jgi:hypothetical protein
MPGQVALCFTELKAPHARPCRFSAKVQGAEAPFYTTPEEGEEFELDQVRASFPFF